MCFEIESDSISKSAIAFWTRINLYQPFCITKISHTETRKHFCMIRPFKYNISSLISWCSLHHYQHESQYFIFFEDQTTSLKIFLNSFIDTSAFRCIIIIVRVFCMLYHITQETSNQKNYYRWKSPLRDYWDNLPSPDHQNRWLFWMQK